jgi:hypothetical protein
LRADGNIILLGCWDGRVRALTAPSPGDRPA